MRTNLSLPVQERVCELWLSPELLLKAFVDPQAVGRFGTSTVKSLSRISLSVLGLGVKI